MIFTNDMTSHLTSGKQVLFADDVQFLDSDAPKKLETLKQRVEGTLDIAINWFTQNRLKINPTKTELLVVKPVRQNLTTPLSIRFGCTEVSPSPHARILGVMVDSALSWEKQISQVTRRCYCVLVGLSQYRDTATFPKVIKCTPLVVPNVQ